MKRLVLNLEHITKRCQQLNMTRSELLRKAGLSHSYLFRDDTGYYTGSIDRLADALKCDPLEILIVKGEVN